MSKQKILVVEDDRDLREALCLTLDVAGYPYEQANSGEVALDILKDTQVDMVISDVNMGGIDGHELMLRIKHANPSLPVALMTAYGDIERAIDAVKNGASDYLVKPFEPAALLDVVKSTLGEISTSTSRNQPVAEEESSKDLLALAKRVAESDSTVLISGESGTGKEVLARYIHDNSPRANQPFIAINCAAIPENMLEAILFGHEKGAYTGAVNGAPGKFEQANGGTILLDEISEMEIGLQAKLLRVLQEREVERLGGRKTIKLDVRVVATTNRDLREYVQMGNFREDLYYRLSVFPLQWKPLRDRPKDVVPLAKRLLKKHGKKMNKGNLKLDTQASKMLTAYNWPGNVRELDNAVQRALVLQQGNLVTAEDFRLEMSPPPMMGRQTAAMAQAAPMSSQAQPISHPASMPGQANGGYQADPYASNAYQNQAASIPANPAFNGHHGYDAPHEMQNRSNFAQENMEAGAVSGIMQEVVSESYAGSQVQPASQAAPTGSDYMADWQRNPAADREASLGDDLKQREFHVILKTLKSVNGSRKQTSEILGISPRTLRYKLAKMRESGLDVDELLAAS